jgi:hypothetical protein
MEGMERVTYYLSQFIAGLDSDYKKAREKSDLEKMREINNTLISAVVFKTDFTLTQIRSGKNGD